MRILVAGATGAVGRPLVRGLVDAGHEVTGLTRRPERVAGLEAAGARGAVCDVTDLHALRAVAREARPELVMDQTTDLPQRYDVRRMDLFYRGMGPLRLLGSPNLLDVANEHGARLVFQSIAFLYQPRGGGLRTEDDPPYLEDAPAPWDAALPVIHAQERRTVAHGGLVLRYGYFYGPGTHFDAGGQLHEDLRSRRFPIVGGGSAVWSFVHVDDAAAAAVAAVGRPGAAGIVNVVDDRPLPMAEWLPEVARRLGGGRPLRVPAWLARRVVGRLPVHFATTLEGASNARAREVLGWSPAYPSILDGLAAQTPSSRA